MTIPALVEGSSTGLREARLGRTRLVAFIGGQRAHDETPLRKTDLPRSGGPCGPATSPGNLDTDDDAALIGQVSSRQYRLRSDGRIRLQSKESMYRSPDEADALAMTFATNRGGVKIWV